MGYVQANKLPFELYSPTRMLIMAYITHVKNSLPYIPSAFELQKIICRLQLDYKLRRATFKTISKFELKTNYIWPLITV